MKVDHFEIEESKVNKGCKILVAVAEDGQKFVVDGDANMLGYLIPYDTAWDAIGQDAYNKLSGR